MFIRHLYQQLSYQPLQPSQSLYNLYADAKTDDEVAMLFEHIYIHDAINHPDYVDVAELLGDEEPYGPYNEIGIQRRIDCYLGRGTI
ncbi:hypothetical protein [Ectobacillus antri]|uniref:hypothetical protein n=1 Tax=Ectobacillus antri TaxID=2486280 RepID=UPI000F5A1EC0|nr:hypothetical protein [Ectobacillus antri]